MTNVIYLLGPAGCGKSTLTAYLLQEMQSRGLNTITLNLDPGVEFLPYTPDIDIRNHISLSEVMREFKLGPNGALVVSVDMVVNHIPHIRAILKDWNPDYLIVDTPGQMELFAFRETGPLVAKSLDPTGNQLILFMIDSFLAKRASSFVSMLMLATSVLTRFGVPQLNVLTKTDTIGLDDVELISDWMNNRHRLLDAMDEEQNSLLRESSLALLEAVEKVAFMGDLLAVSATKHIGIVELLAEIQKVLGKESELDLQEEVEKY